MMRNSKAWNFNSPRVNVEMIGWTETRGGHHGGENNEEADANAHTPLLPLDQTESLGP